MLEWALNNGITTENISLGRNCNGMRGVFAARDIYADDATGDDTLVFAVPTNLCFYSSDFALDIEAQLKRGEEIIEARDPIGTALSVNSEWQVDVGMQLVSIHSRDNPLQTLYRPYLKTLPSPAVMSVMAKRRTTAAAPMPLLPHRWLHVDGAGGCTGILFV